MRGRALLNLSLLLFLVCLVIPNQGLSAEYKNKSPAFIIEYPDDFEKQPLQGKEEVLRVKHPAGIPTFEIKLYKVKDPKKYKMDGAGLAYAKALEKLGSGVKVLSNKPKKLDDGTPAYETEIEWKYQGTTFLVSLVFTTLKDNTVIQIGTHTLGDLTPVREILDSFEFE